VLSVIHLDQNFQMVRRLCHRPLHQLDLGLQARAPTAAALYRTAPSRRVILDARPEVARLFGSLLGISAHRIKQIERCAYIRITLIAEVLTSPFSLPRPE
jgi:hypothetical protein